MAAYPSEYELDVVLRTGDTIRVRPITPEDGELLVDFFERLGPESRYFRFFRVKTTLPPEEVEYFTNVDYDHRMALVAIDEGRMVAVGRYDRTEEEPSVAEVAFAVADDQQGRGLGTNLLQLLTSYARQHDVRDTFEGVAPAYLAQNARVNAAAVATLALAPPPPRVTSDRV